MSDNNKNIKSLDEIVFENRNKEYGAYDLRMTEKKTLLRALIRGGIVLALMVLGVWFAVSDLAKGNKNQDISVEVDLAEIDIPEVEEPEEVEPEPEEIEPEPEQRYQEETAQVKVIMPEPKAEPKKEETVPEVKAMEDKDLGLVDREGPKTASQTGGANEVNTNKEAPKETPRTENPSTGTKPAAPATQTVSARTAAVMAVYPGCEKEAAKGKDAAQKCLSERLSRDLQDELQSFADDAGSQGLSGIVQAQLSFKIDTNGHIVSISPKGDAKLGPEAKKALERITQRQQRRGKTIKPAESDNGAKAILNFNIPVKMLIE